MAMYTQQIRLSNTLYIRQEIKMGGRVVYWKEEYVKGAWRMDSLSPEEFQEALDTFEKEEN